jgi:RNA polymerase sigma factor (TIGR02999 family)
MCHGPQTSPTGEITLLLRRIGDGDAQAAHEILPLVHEAWLRLGGDAQPAWRDRTHFFSAAAEAMRRILIDHARRRQALRHGGAVEIVSADFPAIELAAPMPDDELLRLNDALGALEAHDARKAELLKQWCFVGLTIPEAAELLGISVRTAHRDLAYAKAWLFAEMKRSRD